MNKRCFGLDWNSICVGRKWMTLSQASSLCLVCVTRGNQELSVRNVIGWGRSRCSWLQRTSWLPDTEQNTCLQHLFSHFISWPVNTGQLSILRDVRKGGLIFMLRQKYIYFWKSGNLVLVPFSLIQFIKNPENNETFSLQFVYQAWITDPKTALRQRRKEKKRSAREEQKRRRKESGEGEWWRGLQLTGSGQGTSLGGMKFLMSKEHKDFYLPLISQVLE